MPREKSDAQEFLLLLQSIFAHLCYIYLQGEEGNLFPHRTQTQIGFSRRMKFALKISLLDGNDGVKNHSVKALARAKGINWQAEAGAATKNRLK
jgi:hypothetical protein